MTQENCTQDDGSQSNAEVFQSLEAGDKILWDGKTQPLTVTEGYKETEKDFSPPVMIEGPQGGKKMLNQNKHNPDAIAADSFALNGSSEWIDNLRVVE